MEDKKEQNLEVNNENEIVERIKDYVSLKKVENEFAIGRFHTMEADWNNVNISLDKDITAEKDLLEMEADAINETKKRLERNMCRGESTETFGIAGKVVDIDNEVGLPGLDVKVALCRTNNAKVALRGTNKEYFTEEKTDRYGNFNLDMKLASLKIKPGETVLLVFDILAAADIIVDTEEVTVTPMGGKNSEVRFKVKCMQELSESLAHGKLVRQSLESDAKLVELRAQNVKEAYIAYGRMVETTLSFMKDLKTEISEKSFDTFDIKSM